MIENTIKDKARELVSKLTLEEKAGLCSGMDNWSLKAVERLGLSSIMMTDGPHGLRKQIDHPEVNMGTSINAPAVCFPTSSAIACSFDKDLVYDVGEAIAEECLAEKVSVLLGPGVNEKRSPLCGRNFEYYSEDPLVSGEMAAAMIKGVQSKNIGTSLKHFAVNNQEKRRMVINAVVDERTLRETYLKAFEIAVKKGKPWTVMCSYNRLNGTYCSENDYLLTDILRNEWGFDGAVVSDWGAINDRVLGLQSGLDIEMPSSQEINDNKLISAVRKGELKESLLDGTVCRIIELIIKSIDALQEDYHYDTEKHHKLAVRAAEESAVLLKNEAGILPGNIGQKAAVIGAMAVKPRYQGAGSSRINSIKVDCAKDFFKEIGIDYTFAQGYTLKETQETLVADNEFINEACAIAKDKEIVYIFAGLPEGYESEGFDRTTLAIPDNQSRLIEMVAKVNPNVVVILSGGSVMHLPWADKVKGILLMYLGGEGSGKAAVNLLLGKAVPSGKLSESWPYRIEDTPAYHYFPGGNVTVEYRESIFVGYRYYEAAKKAVRYPFGHGLSYANFEYTDITVDKDALDYTDELTVSFNIKNIGTVEAKETTFIFVGHKSDKVFLPVKELKAFEKVSLLPGEKKQVYITLNTSDFGYYNTLIKDWYAESGTYDIMVGASSLDCSLKISVQLNNTQREQPDYRGKANAYYNLNSGELLIPEQDFETIYGKKLPISNKKASRPYDLNNTLTDVNHTWLGKLVIKYADKQAEKGTKNSPEEKDMMRNMLREMPFHSIIYSSGGQFPENTMYALLDCLNGHYIKGFAKLIKKK